MNDNKKGSMTEEAPAFGQNVKGANEVLGLNTVPPGSARKQTPYVTGLYRTPEDATRAYEGLTTQHGYKTEDVDVIMSISAIARLVNSRRARRRRKGSGKAAPLEGEWVPRWRPCLRLARR